MMLELDPFMGSPSRRMALAGWAPLTALDGAERLVSLARDAGRGATERVQALTRLAQVSPSLAATAASRLSADSTESVRVAASAVLGQVQGLPASDHVV